MRKKEDLATWYNHAYAFVTDTKVGWEVDEAKSVVRSSFTVTTTPKQYGQTTAMMALFPHQWKNGLSLPASVAQFKTLRGTMTVVEANTFTVEYDFNGVLPSLPDRGSYDRAHLKSLLASDRSMTLNETDTYWHGKELDKMANLIPLASQQGDLSTKRYLVSRLKSDLANWFTYTPGETNRYFYYEPGWGGFIGYATSFGTERFNDMHFHFGYFVRASAILSLYAPEFATQYGGMIEHLIRSFASPDRSDPKFPFLRTFDPYEGHSWADGRGSIESIEAPDLEIFGNNQESSSEAMNAWAGIYLWGLATGNKTYRDLGIWGYVTEYAATREYWFDVDNTQYTGGYTRSTVGILWGGKVEHKVWWEPSTTPEYVHGIQLLPLNASMLYLGYEPVFAQANLEEVSIENGGPLNEWQDIFWKYEALFDAASAKAKYTESISFDDGNSKSFTYHWINNLDTLGRADTSVYADTPAFNVFDKDGTKTYACLNPTNAAKTVRFYRRSNDSLLGTVVVSSRTAVATSDFSTFTVEPLAELTAGLSNVTVDPSLDTLLLCEFGSFTLTLNIPAGTFSETVTVSVSSAAVTDGTLRMTGLGFDIVTSPARQPAREIEITFEYSALPGFNESLLRLARRDDASGRWTVLSSNADPAANRVTGTTSHLSRFALFEAAPSANLAALSVFPNPYRPGSGGDFDRPGGIVFEHLPADARLRVFTIAGELVYEAPETDGDGRLEWLAVNAAGEKVASGVYLYLITSPSEKRAGKIAVIR